MKLFFSNTCDNLYFTNFSLIKFKNKAKPITGVIPEY